MAKEDMTLRTKKSFNVDTVLWNRFKKKCIDKDETMTYRLEFMIKKFLGGKK